VQIEPPAPVVEPVVGPVVGPIVELVVEPVPVTGIAGDAPPAPDEGSEHVPHVWLKHVVPFRQSPQSTLAPQAVPAPHSQSTPHLGT